jgi:hypothetical protein
MFYFFKAMVFITNEKQNCILQGCLLPDTFLKYFRIIKLYHILTNTLICMENIECGQRDFAIQSELVMNC